jgi:hypothetical protein
VGGGRGSGRVCGYSNVLGQLHDKTDVIPSLQYISVASLQRLFPLPTVILTARVDTDYFRRELYM